MHMIVSWHHILKKMVGWGKEGERKENKVLTGYNEGTQHYL